MAVPTLQEIRADMLEAAAGFFGREVVVDERTFRSFEMQRRAKNPKAPLSYHVWTALERQLPLVFELYARLAAPLDTSKTPFPIFERRQIDVSRYDREVFDWTETLEIVFGAASSNDLTCAGTAIKENGVIRAADVVLSLLEPKQRLTRDRTDRWVAHHNGILRTLFRLAKEGPGPREFTSFRDLSEVARQQWLELCFFDPSLGYQQLVAWHDGARYRVAPFGVFGGFQLEDSPLPDGTLWLARGNVLESVEEPFQNQLKQFEFLLNRESNEAAFQDFLERNPEFLLALGPYKRIHPQLILHHDEGRGLIPDFFLERIDSNFCDICDLKRPTAELVRHQKHRGRFRDAVMEGIAQLDNYRDWFEDSVNRQAFLSRYGLRAYRPRVVLIIGRRASYYDDVERIRLESNLPNWLRLTTYDDILERVKHWRALILST